MKRRAVLLVTLLGVAFSALAFSGSDPPSRDEGCPLKGTPACPEYPRCCR